MKAENWTIHPLPRTLKLMIQPLSAPATPPPPNNFLPVSNHENRLETLRHGEYIQSTSALFQIGQQISDIIVS